MASAKQKYIYLKAKDKNHLLLNTIKFFLPFFLIIIVFSVVLLKIKYKSEIKNYYHLEEHVVDYRQENIQKDLIDISKDMLFLLSNKNLLEISKPALKENAISKLGKDFLALSIYRRSYDQIRLLDTNGVELVRVNFNEGSPSIVSDQSLQDKSNRCYFKESIRLNAKEFYISPLDLNVENGEIEQPFKPMIRIGTPVFDENNVKVGVIILNYFAYEIVENPVGGDHHTVESKLMLLNSDGYFLKAFAPEMEWGFLYANKMNIKFQKFYGQAWDRMQNGKDGQFIISDGLFSYNYIYPLDVQSIQSNTVDLQNPLWHIKYYPKDYKWIIVSFIPSEVLNNNRQHRILLVVGFLLFMTVILVLIAIRYYNLECIKLDSEKNLSNANQRFKATLDSVDAAIYVADMNTYEILFANNYLESAMGPVMGKTCYKTLQVGQDEVCTFCTNHLLVDKNGEIKAPYVWEFYNEKVNRWFQIHDSAIHWVDGRIVRLEIAFDITSRKGTEHALLESERRLKEAQETAHIGHWELNHEANVLLMSDEVYRIFELKKEEFEPSLESFIDLVYSEDREELSAAFQDSLENHTAYDIIHRIDLKSGKLKFVKDCCYHQYDEAGKPLISFGTVSDITEVMLKEQKIIKQNSELAILNANKDKFFSILAHDLRSPLAGIMQFVDILYNNIDEFSKDEIKSGLENLTDTSKRIYFLLEDLLAWSRIQSKQVVFSRNSFSLNVLVADTVKLFAIMAKEKGVKIENTIDEVYTVSGDKDSVFTIIRNLIVNAIKFTSKNGLVSISGEKNIVNKQILLSIKDTGVGMSEKKLKSLFKIEKSKSTQGTEGEVGTGLGLLLCYDLIKKNRGEIGVKSKEGEGTTFTITLPASL